MKKLPVHKLDKKIKKTYKNKDFIYPHEVKILSPPEVINKRTYI